MGGVRARKKEKSSVSKATRHLKKKQKKVRISSNPIIAAHWDPKLTLQQNYKKLGLKAKLGSQAGGTEKIITKDGIQNDDEKETEKSKAPINSMQEGRIIRDDEGNVIGVEVNEKKEFDDEEEEEWTGFQDQGEEEKTEVVRQLEEAAKNGYSKPHVQSEREMDWAERLINKHGDDFEAMFWDKKLNIYQQSVGDIKRRVYKWKKANKMI